MAEVIENPELDLTSKLDKERIDSLEFVSKRWKTFFNKFKQIDNPELKVSQWTPLNVLSYFDKRFRECYKKNFVYSLNRVPSKCSELALIKKVYAMLCTTNPRTIKEYIDWVFDKKIIEKGLNIRTLAFFMNAALGNEFMTFKNNEAKITRSKELPPIYANVIKECDLPIATYGELAFIKDALDKNLNIGEIDKYKDMFFKLYSYGFEDELLKNLD
jgi:hypothetical protein